MGEQQTYLAEGLAFVGLGTAFDVVVVSFHENDIRTSPKHNLGSNPDDDDKVCADLFSFRDKTIKKDKK